ncbi:glycosyltransferase family 39 protein [Patescibacteria group bacterium]|nr:glycosyltransferase family 39 protein [Patescibacteria group bacterium]
MKLSFKKHEKELLIFLAVVTVLLRLLFLGYSDFYGDETKTFYQDKTIPAKEFLLDQRKGPMQFLVVWFTEKIIGGYHELWTRIPFGIAGVISVFVLYLLVKSLYGWKTGIAAAYLFSVSGFFIAFSRTIQYQSILILFGLSGILLFVKYVNQCKKKENCVLLLLSAISFSASLLCHYDAVFFLIPIFYLVIRNKLKFIPILVYFVAPFLLVASVFYIPYYTGGYFEDNTVNYVLRRMTGGDFSLNNSLYTYLVYNRTILAFYIFLVPFVLFFIKIKEKCMKLQLFWFISALLIYELVILNPGTHIYIYVIPLTIMCGYSFVEIYEGISDRVGLKLANVLAVFVISVTLVNSLFIYVPRINTGYPWNSKISTKYHLYLYGFPYNRSWRELRKYFESKEGVRGIYTNDNDTIAQYYLNGIDYTPPGSNFLPQFYIHVNNPQEFFIKDVNFNKVYKDYYEKEKEFTQGGLVLAEVYRLKGSSNTHW